MNELPDDLLMQMEQQKRRKQIAEAMMQRAQTQDYGHWTQGLAGLANAYLGAKKAKAADAEIEGIRQRANSEAQAAEAAMMESIQSGQPRDKVRSALVQASLSPYGRVRNAATTQQKFLEQDQAREDAATARAEQIRMTEEERRRTKAEADAREADLKKWLAANGGGSGGGEYGTFLPVVGTDGKVSYQFGFQKGPRVGQMASPIGGAPAQYSAEVQGAIAGAKEGAQNQAKRDFNMQGLTEVVGAAREILSGPTKPTGSGVGALMDAAGALVGVSPQGAAEADQLRAISGALTAKMPRMEGPQSDQDVKLYREAAGQIGDATLPVTRRLAALQTVEALNAKYDKRAQKTEPKKSQLSPAEQAELDALRKRFGK